MSRPVFSIRLPWPHAVLLLPLFASLAFGADALELRTSLPSPQPVGTLVTWTASAEPGSSPAYYRFRHRTPGGEFRTIRDFGPGDSIDWMMPDAEGYAEMEVARMDLASGEITTAAQYFSWTSLATDGQPAMAATGHPLVWLFSAPPCEAGAFMAVEYGTGNRAVSSTPFHACREGVSLTFQLAGLLPSTAYFARAILATAEQPLRYGPGVDFRTGEIPADLVSHTVARPRSRFTDQEIILEAPIFPNRPTAVDLAGNVLWYYPGAISVLARPGREGTFWGYVQSPGGPEMQAIREFDLMGMTRRETNAARVNQQLAALGRRPINGFHHEVRELPDGRIVALAGVEQVLTDVQGPGPIDVVGDMIIVFDQDLQVVWTWDGFDHLDPSRAAILNERCSQGSCPTLYLADDGNDWTHANSVQLAPDGNFIVSMRHQDWVLKIDYQNGLGAGNILWRFGKDGDFRLSTGVDADWFSHQHDSEFEPNNTTLTLFDNGNTRRQADSSVTSRGQVFEMDEASRTARVVLNADLGVFSFALGSAQRLRNGYYHFDAGWTLPANNAFSLEVDPTGKISYSLQAAAPQYRTFRMRDLYTPE
ncbi:MAG: aryl-sulfate sulfotransferase [Acidobacteria bacterium]|nr:aryl-sulfate sulfotransferase [Acidobacteriota bacterium]